MGWKCELCKTKVFKERFTLNRHYRNVHKTNPKPPAYESSAYNFKCLETSCNVSFRERKHLSEHLQESHDFIIEEEDVHLKDNDEFEIWKSNIETHENCNYIQERGKISKRDGGKCVKTWYYVCNRSVRHGHAKPSLQKRATKWQGSSKLSHSCISSIAVTANDSGVFASRIKTHYGHERELQHLRLNKHERAVVAKKILMGVSKKEILDSSRNNIGNDIKRMDLLTSQDVTNIKKKIKVTTQDGRGSKQTEDVINIESWVRECESSDENPILFYKPQGIAIEDFQINDFCLIILNKFQEHMLKTYGSNAIFIDSTHQPDTSNFELTVLMVVDNYGESFPVACMFSNRKDVVLFEKFFRCLKSRVGVVRCRTFLSDVIPKFYNTWTRVMCEAQCHLFCSSHVEEDWKLNLSKIDNKGKQCWVYKTLNMLQQNLKYKSEEEFQENLKTAILKMLQDSETVVFGEYFKRRYSNNYRQWAYFFRKTCSVSKNISVKNIHEIIEYFNLNCETGHLDKGLRIVLKYVHDKMLEKKIKDIERKRVRLISDIKKHHSIAAASNFSVDGDDDDNKTWIVKSDLNWYRVEKKMQTSCCTLKCDICDICLHEYSCTCVDFFVNSCICRHIHYVVLKLTTEEMLSIAVVSGLQDHDYLSYNHIPRTHCTSNDKKGNIITLIADIQQKIYSDSETEKIDNQVKQEIFTLLKNVESLLAVKK
ncbi:uncharacterized protein LOC134527942 [Bacillus rossius redtenbacheri]|uniref:uncharacterized protein LOC134527942 n=1 Tax=Bacillus rossius redtenbacheri TaxID=93214 RepID=UPI002FDD59FE